MAEFAANDQEALAQRLEEAKLDDKAIVEEEADEDDEEEGDDVVGDAAVEGGSKKKRKKKKKPAKKKGGAKSASESGSSPNTPNGGAPFARLLGGSTDYYLKYGQSYPPTRPVKELFSNGRFPEGEIQPHGKTKYPNPTSSWARQTEEEKR